MTTMNRPQVLLRKTLSKTKNFFYRTLQNLKSFQPNAPPFVNPFYNVCYGSQKSMPESDDSYRCFSDQWESNHNDVFEKRETRSITLSLSPKVQMTMMEDGECIQSHSNTTEREIRSVVENSKKERGRKEKKKEMELKNLQLQGKKEELCCNGGSGIHYSLAQKMKELEMLDVDIEEEDAVDHLLDIEEVFHHYARLKCPVYLELVDNFFTDMYSEFLLPVSQSSVPSMRRLPSTFIYES